MKIFVVFFSAVMQMANGFDPILGPDFWLLPYVMSFLSITLGAVPFVRYLILFEVTLRTDKKPMGPAYSMFVNFAVLLASFAIVMIVADDINSKIARHNQLFPGNVFEPTHMETLVLFHIVYGLIAVLATVVVTRKRPSTQKQAT